MAGHGTALMISYAQTDGTAGAFQPREDQQIVDFLATTQTPEALERRKMLASAMIIGRSKCGDPKSEPAGASDSQGMIVPCSRWPVLF